MPDLNAGYFLNLEIVKEINEVDSSGKTPSYVPGF